MSDMWNSTRTIGIDQENITLESLEILGERNMVLFGSTYRDEDVINKRFSEYDAVCFHSSDNGANWHKTQLAKGAVTASAYDGKVLAASVGSNLTNETAVFHDNAGLFLSEDKGISWKKVADFKDAYIRDIFFADTSLYIISTNKEDNFWVLKRTRDLGTNWEDVAQLPLGSISPVLVGGNVWLLEAKAARLTRVTLQTGHLSQVQILHPEVKAYMLAAAGKGDDLLIAGVSAGKPVVLSFDGNKVTNTISIHDDGKYPLKLKADGKRMFLVLGKRDNIGTSHSVYVTSLQSDKWEKENLPTYYFKPYFTNASEIWGYYDGTLYHKQFTNLN